MSLIVARKFDDEIRIVCDGRTTAPQEIRKGPRPIYGVLKAVIIDNHSCICYAGRVNIAKLAIKYLLDNNISEYTAIKSYLLKEHTDNDTDFIIGNSLESLKLCKISNGTAEDISIGWIGDSDAFNEYQKFFNDGSLDHLRTRTEEKLWIYAKMLTAMERLIREGKVETVGDFMVGLRSGPTGFNYLTGSTTGFVRQTIPPKTLTKLRFGSAAEGGYSYTVLTPVKAGIGAIGIMYYQGKLGLLFYPKASDSALVYDNITQEQFVHKVKKDYGFELLGGTFT